MQQAMVFVWQVELSDALDDKERLERLPDAALNRLDSLRWEKERADRMIECRRCARRSDRHCVKLWMAVFG